MITLPKTYSYAECYLTLRCNFGCPYCINEHTGVKRKRKELTAREWIMAINNVDFGSIPLTLGGGEPTIHGGFYEIVNNIKVRIDLLSNGSFNTTEFLRKLSPTRFTVSEDPSYKSIRLSFHVNNTVPGAIVEKAKMLQAEGYSVGIFGLNHPENLKANIVMTEYCRSAGVFFFIRDFLGFYEDRLFGHYKYPSGLNGNRKHCQCKIQELLVGPDGNVFRCHRDLYDDTGEVGSLLNIAYEIKDEFRPCDNFGLCNNCDLKQKLGPDLKTSKCSVEVQLG